MIVSASRRTDIPAFHLDWLLRRLRAGYCTVVNPVRPAQVIEVSLRREDVELIVLWTRDGRPLLGRLGELRGTGIPLLVHWTLTGYPECIEPGMADPAALAAGFRALAAELGVGRVVWRYDPVFVSDRTPYAYHAAQFARLAADLRGAASRCVISLCDFYPKVRRRLARQPELRAVERPEYEPEFPGMMRAIAASAAACGLELVSCAEPVDLGPFGVRPAGCIDPDYIACEYGIRPARRKDPAQRSNCRCVVSRDIGAFDTCGRACLYCYARR